MTTASQSNVVPIAQGDAAAPVIGVVVAHAREVPSAAREAYAAELAEFSTNPAVIVLHTCQRVEVYVAIDEIGDVRLPRPPAGSARYEGVRAARHLISTACGLESAVMGEDQILHQIRQALEARRAAGPLDPALDRLFQMALQAGRRAHDWFGGDQRSLSDVAFDEIERRLGSLEGRRVLVVGAGSMGRITALAASRRGIDLVFSNRTEAKAAALAEEFGGETVPWGSAAIGVVGVIVAISGLWPVADASALRGRRVPVVDLSSPPALPEDMQGWLGADFVSVDDLAWGPDTALPAELHDRLDDLVFETGRHYCRWLRARESRPAIRAMTEGAERRRRAELEWLLHRLPNLPEEELALIDRMSQRLVGGILHAPLSALRLDDTGDLGRAARDLFGV